MATLLLRPGLLCRLLSWKAEAAMNEKKLIRLKAESSRSFFFLGYFFFLETCFKIRSLSIQGEINLINLKKNAHFVS